MTTESKKPAIKIRSLDLIQSSYRQGRASLTIHSKKGTFYLSPLAAKRMKIPEGHKSIFLKFGHGDDGGLYVQNINHGDGALRLTLNTSSAYSCSSKNAAKDLCKEANMQTDKKYVFDLAQEPTDDWWFLILNTKLTQDV